MEDGTEGAWHAIPDPDEVLRQLNTSKDGLSNEQAAERLAQYGRNALTPPPKPSFWMKLWAQINT
jgi:Ca2+-transporting ATPase